MNALLLVSALAFAQAAPHDHHHSAEELVGTQVLAVVNFPPKRIGPFTSEVLCLGLPDADGAVVLVGPDQAVPDGARLF